MNMKCALCAILLAAFVTPALAANEFHVAQDTATNKCTIVEQKPTACVRARRPLCGMSRVYRVASV